MRKTANDGQLDLYVCRGRMDFVVDGREVSAQQGMLIRDFASGPARHPWRIGREHAWRLFRPFVETEPDLADTQITVTVAGHAPTDAMSDAVQADEQWAFASIKIRTEDPWADDAVFAPEDERVLVGAHGRGSSPLLASDPDGPAAKVHSLLARRRRQEAATEQDLDTAAEYAPGGLSRDDLV